MRLEAGQAHLARGQLAELAGELVAAVTDGGELRLEIDALVLQPLPDRVGAETLVLFADALGEDAGRLQTGDLGVDVAHGFGLGRVARQQVLAFGAQLEQVGGHGQVEVALDFDLLRRLALVRLERAELARDLAHLHLGLHVLVEDRLVGGRSEAFSVAKSATPLCLRNPW